MDAARSLGLEIQKMPKFIYPDLCEPCGKCFFGCPREAKWTSIKYIKEAEEYGAKIILNTPITDIIISDGKVKGVKSDDNLFEADIVILSAGAIQTPRLLQKIGINAGNNLFVDTFVTVGGMLKNIKYNKEVPMNALIKLDDIVLAPHFSEILVNKLKKYKARKKDVLGLMIKIKDEPSGKVTQDEVIKLNTAEDVALLARGTAIAGAILTEAGVIPETLVSTYARGAHPGGTAAIGDVVDTNLQTELKGFMLQMQVFSLKLQAHPQLLLFLHFKKASQAYS